MSGTASTIAPQKQQLSAPAKAYSAKAYAAPSASSDLALTSIQRRAPQLQDVEIQILCCGVCHSDLHAVRDEWHAFMPTVYPCVPGHEIVGRVTRIGKAVKKFKEGDFAAAGCMVNSCGVCPNCREGLEQYCDNGFTRTYNSEDKILSGVTYGGYSQSIVVDQSFVLGCHRKWIWLPRHSCFVQELPRIPRCGTGMSRKARKWESWGWAAWVIWA